jgi:Alpha/beta hydrolase domain
MDRTIVTGLVAAVLLAPVSTEARITRIEFTRVEQPTFEGTFFGDVGAFEKLVGRAWGEVDPDDPLNAIIQDIELAPRNERGMVEYAADVFILKPMDMSTGNGMLFYNVVNRGNKGGFNTFNIGAVQTENEPIDPGDGFLQEMGYTLVWSGWQPDVLPGNGRMTMQVPAARNPDGSPITGIVRSELTTASDTFTLNLSSGRFTGLTHASYPTVSTDNRTPLADGFLPTLTVRTLEQDRRVPVPNEEWAFGACDDGATLVPSDTQICLFEGFKPGTLYELIYRAKDPLVLGLGYAGMRDLVSFLKHEPADDAGNPNPLWLPAEDGEGSGLTAVFEGSSQSGRNMRTFLHLGFNEDEEGRIVFEGAYPHIGGGRAAFNIRFGQPGRAWGHQVDHLYPAYEFPFSYQVTRDPFTGSTNGILRRCQQTNTCPKIFHVATALEIWEGRQSLGLTDPLGQRDLHDGRIVRTYIMGSTQHGAAPFPPGFGDCQQQSNPNRQAETMRALWVAFTDWVKDGVRPPPSRVPMLRDRTLVHPEEVAFPYIPANDYGGVSRPKVNFLALANPLHVLDFGPEFDHEEESGIVTNQPPLVSEAEYTILVPQVDADGNDLGGILSTSVLAPLATYTGWNLGREGRFEDQLCSLQGSYIPFAETRAERLAVGDPRPSVEERYGTHEGYVDAVRDAAVQLVGDRFLLPEDADRLIAEAEASDVLR